MSVRLISTQPLAPRLASESQKNYAKQVNQTYRACRLCVRSEESDQRAGYQHSARRHYSAQVVAKPHPSRSHASRKQLRKVDWKAACDAQCEHAYQRKKDEHLSDSTGHQKRNRKQNYSANEETQERRAPAKAIRQRAE